jgi:hypothetical protein
VRVLIIRSYIVSADIVSECEPPRRQISFAFGRTGRRSHRQPCIFESVDTRDSSPVSFQSREPDPKCLDAVKIAEKERDRRRD